MQTQPGAYATQQAPPPGYAQPGGYQQPVIVQQQFSPVGPRVYENYSANGSMVCGILMIILGTLLITFNGVALGIEAYMSQEYNGIGNGIFFIITGIFGILAARNRTQCPIVAVLVLSILAALGSLNVIILGAIGAACDANDDPRDMNKDCRDDIHPDEWPDDDTKDARVAINASVSVLGAVAGIVAIVASGLGCAGVGCNNRPPSSGAVIVGSQSTTTTYIATQSGQPATYYGGQENPGYAAAPPGYSAAVSEKEKL